MDVPYKSHILIYMTDPEKALTYNKSIPETIHDEALAALKYFPQLRDTRIVFKFRENIRKSVMQAQPEFKSFIRKRRDRRYFIFISRNFKLGDRVFKTSNIPADVMTGWLGHELGHIMDYERRTKWNLFWFGLRYLYLPSYTRKAERTADLFAIRQGMEKYIVGTKNFIMEHADLPERYKSRIRKYYLSPEDIMQLVQEREAAKN